MKVFQRKKSIDNEDNIDSGIDEEEVTEDSIDFKKYMLDREKDGRIKIKYIPIHSLRHPDYNPREIDDHDFKELRKSIKEFGAVDPAIINTYKGREGIIVGGNQRIDASEAEGFSHYPCVFVHLPLTKEKELNLRLNRNTGQFALKKLFDEFPDEQLLQAGFDSKELTDYKKYLKDTLKEDDLPASIKADMENEGAEEEKVKEVDASEIQSQLYCAIEKSVDVGRGWCTHNCVYCFTKITPAGLMMKPGKYSLSSNNSLENVVKRSKKLNTPLTTGVCNDPSMTYYAEKFLTLVKLCEKHKVLLIVQTKNPGAVLDLLLEAHADMSNIIMKTSFSFHDDDKSAIIEPGAPQYNDRLDGLIDCVNEGTGVILRFSPFFIDYYEGMEDTVKRLYKVKCERLVVETFRASATGIGHLKGVGKVLDKDNYSVEEYIHRIGRKDKEMFGSLHWYDIEPTILREAYNYIKELANDYNMRFGICNGAFGIEHIHLNEGDYCCQCSVFDERNISIDEDSFTHLAATGNIHKLHLPEIFDNEKYNDRNEYDKMIQRISWVNDREYGVRFDELDKR